MVVSNAYVRLRPKLTCDWVRPGVPRKFWPLPIVEMNGVAPLTAPTPVPPKP